MQDDLHATFDQNYCKPAYLENKPIDNFFRSKNKLVGQ